MTKRVGIVSLAALGVAGLALAQSSANFELSWFALDGGGGRQQSATFALQGSLGQTVSGSSASANHAVVGGFVQDFAAVAGGDRIFSNHFED